MQRIVIIGGGQATVTLCERLRNLGYQDTVTVICEEPHLPYQRPPLSKAYFLGDIERERLFLKPESFYQTQKIDLKIGQRAVAIDRDAKLVRLDNGDSCAYDRLAILTGARPKPLPQFVQNSVQNVQSVVHYVRNVADIDALRAALAKTRKVAVIGGGYIGLEAAAVLRKRGIETHLIHRSASLLSRVASQETANWFAEQHQARGVELHLNRQIHRLHETAQGMTLTLESTGANSVLTESIDGVDKIIVGIGVAPNQELAEQAGLTCAQGIVVDAYTRSSDPSIFAAGDVAVFPTQAFGTLRLESVQNAIDQVEVMARNMLGESIAYEPKPWFWSDQYEIKFQSAGLPNGYNQVVTRIDSEKARSHWLFRDKQLICIEAINDARAYMVGKRLLAAGKSPDPIIVADMGTDLKSLLR